MTADAETDLLGKMGVTTAQTLTERPAIPEDVQEEVAEVIDTHERQLANATAAAKQVADPLMRGDAMNAIRWLTLADRITFYSRDGSPNIVNTGTNAQNKRNLLAYYLGKRSQFDGQRVFFGRPPVEYRPDPQWACFVSTGPDERCPKKTYTATQLIGHVKGFHADESVNLYPDVLRALQRKAASELQPGIIEELGLSEYLDDFRQREEPEPVATGRKSKRGESDG